MAARTASSPHHVITTITSSRTRSSARQGHPIGPGNNAMMRRAVLQRRRLHASCRRRSRAERRLRARRPHRHRAAHLHRRRGPPGGAGARRARRPGRLRRRRPRGHGAQGDAHHASSTSAADGHPRHGRRARAPVGGLGNALRNVDLIGTRSYDEVIARVRGAARDAPAGRVDPRPRLGPERLGDTRFPTQEKL